MDAAAAQTYWRAAAACQSCDPDLFFPVSVAGPAASQAATAKAVCARCPVRSQCLDFALSSRQSYGIWGGLTELERLQLLADGLWPSAHQLRLTAGRTPRP